MEKLDADGGSIFNADAHLISQTCNEIFLTCCTIIFKLVGTKKAVAIAINNNKPQKRYTLLKDRLMKIMDSKVSNQEIEANEQNR